MKNKYILFLVSLIIILLDQVIKLVIVKTMSLGQSIVIIKNIVHITYTTNTGAGFGILKNMNSFLMWISIIIIGIILYYYDKIPDKRFPQISAGLILGGAAGNLIDRIFISHVIDFIDFRIWPVFNLADSAITIGVICLLIYFWRK